jgi:hypothetical protein
MVAGADEAWRDPNGSPKPGGSRSSPNSRHTGKGKKVNPRHDAAISEQSLRIYSRAWTAAEKHKLRGLAKKNTPMKKIARTLNRSVASTGTMAAKLGIVLNDES